MSSSYHHLRPEERATIMIQHGQGATLSSIARLLGRHRSTISRELSRQSGRSYSAVRASERYRSARRRCGRPSKLQAGTRLSDRVVSMLEHRQWSPEQIAVSAVAAFVTGNPLGPIEKVWENMRAVSEAEGAKQGLRLLWATKEKSSGAALGKHYAAFRTRDRRRH